MQNPLDLLEKIVRAYGVAMRRYGESLTGLEEYDNGLRSLLFSRHDTRRLAEFLRATEFGVLYIMDDPYDCRYCFFRTPPPPESAERISGTASSGRGGNEAWTIPA